MNVVYDMEAVTENCLVLVEERLVLVVVRSESMLDSSKIQAQMCLLIDGKIHDPSSPGQLYVDLSRLFPVVSEQRLGVHYHSDLPGCSP